MLIKKLLKTLLFTSLITSTVAQANEPNIEHTANPSTYHTNVDHLHNDMHNYWYRTPNIIICETSNVTKGQVNDAVNFWKEAGFKIGKVYKETETNYICPTNTHEFIYDVIFITHDMQNIGKKSWGVTKRFYDWCDELYGLNENHCIRGQGFHSYVIGARIQLADDIQRNSRTTTIIAHELGHALGFKHVDNYKDIMTNQSIGRYLPYY